jgi:hypothetical protein
MKRWRQFLCVHWFDEITSQFKEGWGEPVKNQQQTFTVTLQSRTCAKCGFTDSRRISEPIYEGWT